MIEEIRPGQPVRAEQIKRIERMASMSLLRSTAGIVKNSPDGQMIDKISRQIARYPALQVSAKNSTGADLLTYEVAAVSGQVTETNELSWSIVLDLEVFGADNLELMVVASENIPTDAVGSVYVQGVAWVKCTGTLDDYATPVSGTTEMIMATSGPAQVLYYDSGSSMAIVRFGGGNQSGGGTAEPNWSFVNQLA